MSWKAHGPRSITASRNTRRVSIGSGMLGFAMSDGPVSITFGLAFSNLPIVNIRQEFEQYVALLADPDFCAGLRIVRQPVELPTLTWRGLSHNVLTYMVQRAILGLEASEIGRAHV